MKVVSLKITHVKHHCMIGNLHVTVYVLCDSVWGVCSYRNEI